MPRLTLLLLLAGTLLKAAPLPVTLLLFGSADDKKCVYVQKEVLAPLKKNLGDSIDVRIFNTDDKAGENYFHRLEQIYNDHHNALPALFVGGRFLTGRTNIRNKVRAKVRQVIVSGKEALPDTAARKAQDSPYTGKAGTARFLLFYAPDCGYCTDVKEELVPVIKKNYGKKAVFKLIDMSEPDGHAVVRRLEAAYHEPGNYTPLIFADGRFLSGKNEIAAKLDWWTADIISRGGCAWPTELKK